MTHQKKMLVQTLVAWLPLAAAAIGVSGIVYLSVQQNYRLNANDPQIQLTQDLTEALAQGAPPELLLPQSKTDMSKSLQPFAVIFSATGTPMASSAQLNDQTPSLPNGVLEKVAKTGEGRITWQPAKGVRIAAVIKQYKDGYVLVGRNLQEVEKRITLLGMQTGVALLIVLIVTFLLKLVAKQFGTKELEKEVHHEVMAEEHHHTHG